jgi:hypothetical protein
MKQNSKIEPVWCPLGLEFASALLVNNLFRLGDEEEKHPASAFITGKSEKNFILYSCDLVYLKDE